MANVLRADASNAEINTSSYPGVVVFEAAKTLRAQYVDPLLADRLAELLLAKLRSGAYRDLSKNQLALTLTADLRSLTQDLHLSVSYEPPLPTAEGLSVLAEDDLHPRSTNWGVQTVARLQGNVGLLRLTHLPSPPDRVAQKYAAAMELLKDTAALVLDLTINHGGGTDTYGYFLSYFLDGERELSRIQWRNEPMEVISTSNAVLGPRYGESRPLFVAISQHTFSAGEAIALDLKNHKRATLVGRRTRGGAHAGNFFKLPQDFKIFVVMGTRPADLPDWEGIGVSPDVETRAELAVATAHYLALQVLLQTATEPKLAQVLRNVLDAGIENLSSFAN